ncbi:MAG: acylglycerol kinase family protein [Patescibacteria group bacterium]|nr:acylglycerol kinase family protein [Patescibacteria group bacterium]
MNVFIYDAVTEKYKKTTRRFEEKINTLGLQGKIVYLQSIKNHRETIEQEIRNGAKTIIILGNDQTVNNVINILANISENVPVFIVPIGTNNSIAESMGIKNEKEAAFILSARRMENIKIAKANHLFFINNCQISNKSTNLKIDNSYSVYSQKETKYKVVNLTDKESFLKEIKSSPQDNILELIIKNKGNDISVFPIKKNLEINNDQEKILLDNSIKIDSPASISISDKTMSFIVGKERLF